MKDEESITLSKTLAKKSKKLLREAMSTTGFSDAIETVVDEEDGSVYYVIGKCSKLTNTDIAVVDDALIDVAKMYQAVNTDNDSRYYRRVGRMVFYALYELESREILEHEIVKGI